jgi:hypothetical protein
MNTTNALTVYLVFIVFAFAIFIRIKINIWSSLILALLAGQILLNILCPPSKISPWSPNSESISSAMAIYIVIQIVTPLIVIIYVFIMGWHDRKKMFKY